MKGFTIARLIDSSTKASNLLLRQQYFSSETRFGCIDGASTDRCKRSGLLQAVKKPTRRMVPRICPWAGVRMS